MCWGPGDKTGKLMLPRIKMLKMSEMSVKVLKMKKKQLLLHRTRNGRFSIPGLGPGDKSEWYVNDRKLVS